MNILTDDGKIAGLFDPHKKKFTKVVKGSIHMLRIPRSWAIDSDVVKKLGDIDCRSIVIIDSENHKKYVIPYPDFLEHAIDVNRGFGDQKALPLIYWDAV